MKYYPIDESAARRAKQANSLSDYAEESATSEYRREIDRAATLAEECKKGKTEAQQEKIDYLLDRYARRLADNMNASNRNLASCPSVMVAGWSNFPVRKKQQQLSRDDTLMREWRDIQGILDQIRAVGHGGISGMDADARERVQAKLTEREVMQEKMKSVNAYWRKHGALVGCPGLSDKEVARLTASISQSASTGRSEPPYPRWALDNNGAEIRRLRSRLAVLDAQQAQGDSEQTFRAVFCASPRSGCSWFLMINPPPRYAILSSSGVSAGRPLRARGSDRIPPTADTQQSRPSRPLRRPHSENRESYQVLSALRWSHCCQCPISVFA